MPSFGPTSQAQLFTIDPRLQRVLLKAITYVDFSIVEGYRNKDAQERAYNAGATHLHYPYGNHNAVPSRAADIMPYPIDWSDKTTAIARVAFLMGIVRVCAVEQGVKVRFGFDWNRNLDPRDETFLDWDHVELDEP